MIALLVILIPILIQIESNGNDSAVGDGGDAVGCLQIHKIMVDDVNRILHRDVFQYSDRYDRQDSVIICAVYLMHYAPNKIKGLSQEEQLVVMARLWNGGPTGHKKKATLRYGEKVRNRLPNSSKTVNH